MLAKMVNKIKMRMGRRRKRRKKSEEEEEDKTYILCIDIYTGLMCEWMIFYVDIHVRCEW